MSVQSVGAEVLTLLHSVVRALALYEPNNSAVQKQVGALDVRLGEWIGRGETLRLQLREDEFFANGRLLRVDPGLYERYTDLAQGLARFQVGELRFAEDYKRADLDALVGDLASGMRSKGASLQSGYGSIQLKAFAGRSMASFRLEPDRLAVWLYAGFLDVVEKLYAAYGRGEAPSLVPLRRVLQLLIDNMRRHGGIYQLLTAVRDHGRPISQVRLRVAVAIDAVGFGIYLGLDNARLMTLALASVLGGLTEDPDPEQRLRPLFRYPGLGATAMPLILTVHDAVSARLGKPAGVPGRMLAVVEALHELTSAPLEGEPLPAPVALARMSAGEVQGVEKAVARLLGAYKGRYPLGSPVELDDGRRALVMSHGVTDAGKHRPVVALLGEGELGERLDLSVRGDLDIAKVLSGQRIGLDLSGIQAEVPSHEVSSDEDAGDEDSGDEATA